MHFQSIGRVTPKIWQNLNWIRFHKNSDSVDRHQKKFQDKYKLSDYQIHCLAFAKGFIIGAILL